MTSVNYLIDNRKVGKVFWKTTGKLTKSNIHSTQTIGQEQWEDYFKDIFNLTDIPVDFNVLDRAVYSINNHDELTCDICSDDNCNDILNRDITQEEIESVLQTMKCGKAAGTDGIKAEMFQCCSNLLMPYLVAIFNNIMSTGIFPSEWAKGIIVPLHKKGNVNSVDNYRGISQMDTFGKILTSVLNNRLQRFAKLFEKIPESQAGFRQAYCTADNIFTLHCLVQKYLSKGRGRFYCIFVDFKKAFESINRKLRWYSIMNKGIHGRLFVVIENMYYKVKAAVRISNTSISSYFDCMSGVRQGCVLSPLLFAMFISEIQDMLEDAELRGIFVGQEFQDLLLLLYADDLCIFDDTVIGLQKKIDI